MKVVGYLGVSCCYGRSNILRTSKYTRPMCFGVLENMSREKG